MTSPRTSPLFSDSLLSTNTRTDSTRQFSGRGICVPVTASTAYTSWANYRVPAQPAGDVRAGFGYFLYDNADSSGSAASVNYSGVANFDSQRGP